MRHGVAPVLGQRDQEGEDRGADGGQAGGSGSMGKRRQRRGKEAEGWDRADDGQRAGRDMDERKEEAKKRGNGTVGGEGKEAGKDGSAEGDARVVHGGCTCAT